MRTFQQLEPWDAGSGHPPERRPAVRVAWGMGCLWQKGRTLGEGRWPGPPEEFTGLWAWAEGQLPLESPSPLVAWPHAPTPPAWLPERCESRARGLPGGWSLGGQGLGGSRGEAREQGGAAGWSGWPRSERRADMGVPRPPFLSHSEACNRPWVLPGAGLFPGRGSGEAPAPRACPGPPQSVPAFFSFLLCASDPASGRPLRGRAAHSPPVSPAPLTSPDSQQRPRGSREGAQCEVALPPSSPGTWKVLPLPRA